MATAVKGGAAVKGDANSCSCKKPRYQAALVTTAKGTHPSSNSADRVHHGVKKKVAQAAAKMRLGSQAIGARQHDGKRLDAPSGAAAGATDTRQSCTPQASVHAAHAAAQPAAAPARLKHVRMAVEAAAQDPPSAGHQRQGQKRGMATHPSPELHAAKRSKQPNGPAVAAGAAVAVPPPPPTGLVFPAAGRIAARAHARKQKTPQKQHIKLLLPGVLVPVAPCMPAPQQTAPAQTAAAGKKQAPVAAGTRVGKTGMAALELLGLLHAAGSLSHGEQWLQWDLSKAGVVAGWPAQMPKQQQQQQRQPRKPQLPQPQEQQQQHALKPQLPQKRQSQTPPQQQELQHQKPCQPQLQQQQPAPPCEPAVTGPGHEAGPRPTAQPPVFMPCDPLLPLTTLRAKSISPQVAAALQGSPPTREASTYLCISFQPAALLQPCQQVLESPVLIKLWPYVRNGKPHFMLKRVRKEEHRVPSLLCDHAEQLVVTGACTQRAAGTREQPHLVLMHVAAAAAVCSAPVVHEHVQGVHAHDLSAQAAAGQTVAVGLGAPGDPARSTGHARGVIRPVGRGGQKMGGARVAGTGQRAAQLGAEGEVRVAAGPSSQKLIALDSSPAGKQAAAGDDHHDAKPAPGAALLDPPELWTPPPSRNPGAATRSRRPPPPATALTPMPVASAPTSGRRGAGGDAGMAHWVEPAVQHGLSGSNKAAPAPAPAAVVPGAADTHLEEAAGRQGAALTLRASTLTQLHEACKLCLAAAGVGPERSSIALGGLTQMSDEQLVLFATKELAMARQCVAAGRVLRAVHVLLRGLRAPQAGVRAVLLQPQ